MAKLIQAGYLFHKLKLKRIIKSKGRVTAAKGTVPGANNFQFIRRIILSTLVDQIFFSCATRAHSNAQNVCAYCSERCKTVLQLK